MGGLSAYNNSKRRERQYFAHITLVCLHSGKGRQSSGGREGVSGTYKIRWNGNVV